MERTVPTTESESVELYQRTYYSLLRSSAEVKLRSLEEVHAGTNSLLHPAAREEQLDMAAFIYSMLRLPEVIQETGLVVLGQSAEMFEKAGLTDFLEWREVFAPARRRRCFYNGSGTLGCYIASRSDIDDVIPLLVSYQIEWNKLHLRLSSLPAGLSLDDLTQGHSSFSRLAEILGLADDDVERLYAIWRTSFLPNLKRIANQPKDMRIRLLSSSLSEYRRARNVWWENILRAAPELRERPVYFVSSNTHSLVNVLSGFPLRVEAELLRFLDQPGNSGLRNEWRDIQNGRVQASPENFWYYVFKKYQASEAGKAITRQQVAYERSVGILRVRRRRSFDVDAQVIRMRHLDVTGFDPRLGNVIDAERIKRSDALILNIDYPLGLAAYDILAELSSHVGSVQGVYVMGKAATLNAVIGDLMISNVTHDEHSRNTYLFPNCFSAGGVAPNLIYGTVLDNQKSVTVQGTFLQNHKYMDVFYREGYTVIEMEAGPYLSAVYEMHRPQRYPANEIVNLYGLPFDLGFIHYASDTPMGKGKNLGAGSLSYMGMDPTYAATLAVARRILEREQGG